MKRYLALLLGLSLLMAGCTANAEPTETLLFTPGEVTEPTVGPQLDEKIVEISLEGQDITVSGSPEGAVSLGRDIVYYEERTEYESGNPYGDGGEADMHSAEEAAAHLVVHITQPGTYRVRGKLDLGQIKIDLGEEAKADPEAVVNLILDGVDITCTVAPAILFQNVYECDGDWTVETAQADVDTTAAGANLILAENSNNTISGSYVAKIYQDQEGEKKLCKQDGAIYSYMSMNVYGPGALDLTAENEGLDTELHLTLYGGEITIRSGNDGINTNEDGVSVTTILGGQLYILAGLGAEGDGIDSNGYLVIRGGTVVSAANPAADAGLDSDLGSFVHGGTVIALGSTMDWAESDSDQPTMNLQFAQNQQGSILITKEDGTVVFAYDPALGGNDRPFQGAVISCPQFQVGEGYHVYVGATIEGTQVNGLFASVTSFSGGTQMAYTGSDVGMGPGGGRPGFGVTPPGEMPESPEGDAQIPPQPSEGIEPMPGGTAPNIPGGERPGDVPEPPDGTMPSMPEGQEPPGSFGSFGGGGMENQEGLARTVFYLQDKVNAFSGIRPVE